ncbi:histidine phosphatase superfamily [Scleroderma yunnanense]
MYIPAINLLQLSLSSLTGIFSGADFAHEDSLNANCRQRFATLSPYHDRPHIPGISADLPSDCTVDQVMMLHRHGSRGPAGEQSYIGKLVQKLDNATLPKHLPRNLRFLKDGYQSDLVPEALTVIGREQLFDHGVQFSLEYPTFSTDVFLSSTVQRVIDSAQYFRLGLGQDAKIVTVDELGLPVNWILPWESCPNFKPDVNKVGEWVKKYVPPITKRLNHLLRGVDLTNDDVQGALFACPYDLAAHDESPWCGVFLPHELRGLEYQYDLMMDILSGHISRNDTGPLLGSVYVNKLIERFTNATGDAKELYLEFGHDTSILLALAALNLNKDKIPLTPDHIRFPRKFRTSDQSPFATRMVWERFTCTKSFDGPQIRLLLNSATYPLAMCQKSLRDRRFGTCSLDEFVAANSYSTSIHYGDATWNASCVL